jgi:GDP-L-fucose synthase
MKEEYILFGALESTNEPFAVAKIAGIKMCESFNRQYGTDFISVIPTNIYGRNQNYEPMNSLVVPSLIRRFHEARVSGAREIVIWGTGRPARDFLYADDLAEASIFLMEHYAGNELINIGTGQDYTIRELVEIIRQEVGYDRKIIYDPSKPDGVLKKLQDTSKIQALGWKHRVDLAVGIHLSYQDYLSRLAD